MGPLLMNSGDFQDATHDAPEHVGASMGPLLMNSGDGRPRAVPAAPGEASMGPLLMNSGDRFFAEFAGQGIGASMGPLLMNSGDSARVAAVEILVPLQWGRC